LTKNKIKYIIEAINSYNIKKCVVGVAWYATQQTKEKKR